MRSVMIRLDKDGRTPVLVDTAQVLEQVLAGDRTTLNLFLSSQADRRRVVKRTTLDDGTEISTVLLSAAVVSDDEPLIYETAVFGRGDGTAIVDRYATENEAELGHALWVERTRKGQVSWHL